MDGWINLYLVIRLRVISSAAESTLLSKRALSTILN